MVIFEAGAFRGAPCCRRLRGSTLRRAFHGLTPTAKCCRRVRGSTRTPGLAPGDQIFFPEGTWIDRINRTRSCCSVSEARQGPLSGEAGWGQTILYILSIHVNQGTTHARRRNQTPHRGFGHSGPLQFGAVEHHAVAAYAAQHCADLSMGLRPRLSAAAASRLVWSPRACARGLSLLKNLVPSPMS